MPRSSTHSSERQDDRKRSLEARGITVITTSGALATLLFGLQTVGARSAHLAISGAAAELLKAALVSFAAAAALAITTNIPLRYREPVGGTPDKLLNYWFDDVEHSSKEVAKAWGKVFSRAKKMNDLKAWLLFSAIVAEVLAVGAVAGSVWLLL